MSDTIGVTGKKWLSEVELCKTEKEANHVLNDPGCYEQLDLKIAALITNLAKGEFGKEIMIKAEAKINQCVYLTGRIMLWYEYDYYQARNGCLDSHYDLEDLMSLSPGHDDNLENFIVHWRWVIQGFEKSPSKKRLHEIFYKKVKNNKNLKEDMAHYERQKKGHKDKSHNFFMERVTAWIDRRRDERNLQQRRGRQEKRHERMGGWKRR